MKTLFKVWRDEYHAVFSDVGVMLIFFGAILVYPFFYPLPYACEVLKDIPVAVTDMSRSHLSRRLVRMLDAGEFIRVAGTGMTFDQAKKSLLKGNISGLIYIPADFEKKVLRGEQASVALYADATSFLTYKQLLSGVYRTTGTLSAGIEIRRMQAAGTMEEQARILRDPLPLVSFPMFNAAGGYATYIVPAVLVLILQQTLLVGIGMLAGTRRENAAGQAADSPAGAVSLVLGRSLCYFSIYLVHAAYLFGVLFRFYHFPERGQPLDLFLFIIPYLFASIFLAQGISVLFRNREISIVFFLFTSIPALFLSGFAWPKSAIPDWLNRLAVLLPSTPGIEGVLRISQMGARLKDTGTCWLTLLSLCAGYFVLAVFLIRLQAADHGRQQG